MFVLEALKAKHGDALLLHYGDADPATILIDGGPGGVYRRFLKKRLQALREARDSAEPLALELAMVSHIDNDHIKGMIDLFNELREAKADHQAPLVEIKALWHNSFQDIIGGEAKTAAVESAALQVAGTGSAEIDLPLQTDTRLVLASVKEGRQLRDLARVNGISLNPGFEQGLIVAEAGARRFGELSLRLLGPSQAEVDALKKEWDKQVVKLLQGKKKEKAKAAAYLDGSVFNLSSLVVLAEYQGRRMLLTGDARGDRILEALTAAELLTDQEVFHVDLLKLPHHGSDRNVDVDFFRRVTADHYVISGDGRHGNPEVDTFAMIFAARPAGDPYTLHLTYEPAELSHDYPLARLNTLFRRAEDDGVPFRLNHPPQNQLSMTIEL